MSSAPWVVNPENADKQKKLGGDASSVIPNVEPPLPTDISGTTSFLNGCLTAGSYTVVNYCFSVCGIRLWNSLPASLRISSTSSWFRTTVVLIRTCLTWSILIKLLPRQFDWPFRLDLHGLNQWRSQDILKKGIMISNFGKYWQAKMVVNYYFSWLSELYTIILARTDILICNKKNLVGQPKVGLTSKSPGYAIGLHNTTVTP